MLDDVSPGDGFSLHSLLGHPFPFLDESSLRRIIQFPWFSQGRLNRSDLSVPHNPLIKLCPPGVELEEAPAWIVWHEDRPGGEMNQGVTTSTARMPL